MAEELKIQRAERKQARLRLAVSAASGGGKTATSLELAFGIVEEYLSRGLLQGTLEGKVGVIDTERKSSMLYAHRGPFDVVDLGPPYTVDRYIAAQQMLERAGCFVIIEDSISHAWAGEGGVLDLLSTLEDRQRFSAFGTEVNPAQNRFVDAILASPCHIIATMRSKTAWVLADTEKKNRDGSYRTVKEPKRIGMAPIQRPGIEYEFTTLLDLATDTHFATVLKNRCRVFEEWTPRILTREHGRQLASWLLEGAPPPSAPLSGSPQERADARLAAALRAFERAQTVPDLAVAFEGAQRDLRAFPPAVAIERIREMIATLVEAKDLRKDALRPVGKAPAAGDIPPGALDKPASPPPPGPKEVLNKTIEKIASKRGGFFADMTDDVPF